MADKNETPAVVPQYAPFPAPPAPADEPKKTK